MPRMIRGATALFMLAVLFVAPACAEATKVTFLLVNDIYQMSAQVMPDGRTRGGFARLAAVVKAERRKGGHVIVAHAGDMISPSLMSGLDRVAHTIALSNLVGLDIFAPGNHEFDFGKAAFLQRMREAKFPVYAANLRGPDGQPLAGIKDRGIVTFDGVRIGLTGATYDDSARASTPEDLQFLPTVASQKAQAETLRREGADFVAAVVHADRAQDYELFGTRSVDLILSGHNHDLFVNYDERNAMAESSYDAHYLVAVDVAIEVTTRNGVRATKWWPQFRIIDTATVTPDPAVAAAVLPYEKELAREMDVALGTTAVELDSRNATVRTREAAIGNLIADAMRASARADAAIMNGGGIRAGKVYPPGATITRRDVLAEMPFSNRVVTVEIVGKELKRAIENGLSALPNAAGRFPQVSGLTIAADGNRPVGDRVVSVRVGAEPLDDAKTYKVATNDFMARGGDGYDMLRDAKHLLPVDDSPMLANEIMVYLRAIGTVQASIEGRLILK
jgi:5'-nucleotidase / UDP-sugar diphosphatase